MHRSVQAKVYRFAQVRDEVNGPLLAKKQTHWPTVVLAAYHALAGMP